MRDPTPEVVLRIGKTALDSFNSETLAFAAPRSPEWAKREGHSWLFQTNSELTVTKCYYHNDRRVSISAPNL